MVLLDGKKTSADIKEEIGIEVSELVKNGVRAPHLAAILVGTDGASMTYVNAKVISREAIIAFLKTLQITQEQ